MSIMTDGKFAVVQARAGIAVETYKDRREMVDDQIRMLFVDGIWHSGKDQDGDNLIASALAASLMDAVQRIGVEVVAGWFRECPGEDEEDEEDEEREVRDPGLGGRDEP